MYNELGTTEGIHMFRTIEPKILYFGTPVVLVSTLNEEQTSNIAPISSAWALGWNVVMGLGTDGKTYENLCRHPECVLNLPSPSLWSAVEKLAPLTGKNPVPQPKQNYSRYVADKFEAAGLTPVSSDVVQPERIAECSLQLEAIVKNIIPIGSDGEAVAVDVAVVKVHARQEIIKNNHHIDPNIWQPLIYNFRHYFGLGTWPGKSFRAED